MAEPKDEKKDPNMGTITKSVTKDADGFQKVPRMPGAPREADDFNPDGSAKNEDVIAVQEAERKALLGEEKAPPHAPESERQNTQANIKANKDAEVAPAAPPDVTTPTPSTTSPVPTMTPVADATKDSATAEKP